MKMKTGLFEFLTVVFAFTTFAILSPALAGPINIKGSGTNDAKVKIDSVEGDHPSVNFLDNGKQKGVVGWYRTEDAMKFVYSNTLASSNGITLKPGGNVGIGTSMPYHRLEVHGYSCRFWLAGEGDVYITHADFVTSIFGANCGDDCGVQLALGANGTEAIRIDNSANVGIGTTSPSYPLEMASGAHVTTGGVWTNASSREYKENIRDLSYDEATLALLSLKPSKFNYKVDKDDDYLGFIAEDVPDLVATKDRKGLSPMDIVAVLTKVVQKQQKEYTVLNTKFQQQQKENAVLNTKLAAIMSRLEALEK